MAHFLTRLLIMLLWFLSPGVQFYQHLIYPLCKKTWHHSRSCTNAIAEICSIGAERGCFIFYSLLLNSSYGMHHWYFGIKYYWYFESIRIMLLKLYDIIDSLELGIKFYYYCSSSLTRTGSLQLLWHCITQSPFCSIYCSCRSLCIPQRPRFSYHW